MAKRAPSKTKGKSSGLTHFDSQGQARMVDVSPKPETHRKAVASAQVLMQPATAKLIAKGEMSKGDVLAIARIAGIQGIKRTSDLIPLCHPLRISGVDLKLRVYTRSPARVEIQAEVQAVDRTGVEMEALTAVSVAALTVYDMCKAVDRGMRISQVQLEEKLGGKSGHWQR
jgi:cyclic pyranopterin phosphate synthase